MELNLKKLQKLRVLSTPTETCYVSSAASIIVFWKLLKIHEKCWEIAEAIKNYENEEKKPSINFSQPLLHYKSIKLITLDFLALFKVVVCWAEYLLGAPKLRNQWTRVKWFIITDGNFRRKRFGFAGAFLHQKLEYPKDFVQKKNQKNQVLPQKLKKLPQTRLFASQKRFEAQIRKLKKKKNYTALKPVTICKQYGNLSQSIWQQRSTHTRTNKQKKKGKKEKEKKKRRISMVKSRTRHG